MYKARKEKVVWYSISLMSFGTHNNAQCNINSFINRVFTVKLQYQPIQVKAWEAYKQVGSTPFINDSLAAKYGNKKTGNIENC